MYREKNTAQCLKGLELGGGGLWEGVILVLAGEKFRE